MSSDRRPARDMQQSVLLCPTQIKNALPSQLHEYDLTSEVLKKNSSSQHVSHLCPCVPRAERGQHEVTA